MKKAALLFLSLVAAISLFAQGEGEMTVSGLRHCHSPNSCASIQSLTANWRITSLMGEPLVRVSFKWTAGANTPANFFDSRDFIVLRCVAKGSSQVVGYIRSGGDCPVSGKGYGHNTGGSPSWTSIFCDSEGNSLGYSAEKTKEIWKKGFSVAGVSLVRSGGLDADKPNTSQSSGTGGGGTPTTTVTGSSQSQRMAELQAKQRKLEEESKQRQQQQQQQQQRAAQERARQQQTDRSRQQQTIRQTSPGEARRFESEMANNYYKDSQRETQEMLDKVKQGAQDMMNTWVQIAEKNRIENEKWKAECAAKDRAWEANEARKKREKEELERQYEERMRQKAEERRREQEAKAAQATLLGQNRLAIVNEFNASDIPLSSAPGSSDKLYYFGYSFSSDMLKDNTCTFLITPTFEVGRRADGTWPYTSNVEGELRLTFYSSCILHGAYSTYDEAEQARQLFMSMLQKTGVAFKDKAYAGKVATVLPKPMPAVAPALKASFEGAEQLFASDKYDAALQQLFDTERQPGGSSEQGAYLKIWAYDKLLTYPHTDSLELLLPMHQAINSYLSTYASYPIKEKYAEVQALQQRYDGLGLGYQRVAAALSGNAEEQYQLGMVFYRSQLYRRAMEQLTRSAEQKHPKACGKAGLLYYTGLGRVKPDPNRSAKYLTWAVEANDWEGVTLAAYHYLDGLGNFRRDADKAAELFKKAYEMSQTQRDNPDADGAMFLTGQICRYGRYGEPNYYWASFWYNRAAQQSHSVYQQTAQKKANEVSSFLDSKMWGNTYFNRKDYPSAIRSYRDAYNIIKDAQVKDRLFEALLANADQLFLEKKDRYNARKAYDEAGELVGADQQKLAVILPKLEEFVYSEMRGYSFGFTSPSDHHKLSYYLACFPNGKFRQNLTNVIDFVYPNAAKYDYKWDYYTSAKRLYLIAAFTHSNSGKASRFVKKAQKCMKKLPGYGERSIGFAYDPSTKDDWTKGKLVVSAVLKGYPAEGSGLQLNDVITHIDGIPVEKLEPWQARELMRSFTSDEKGGCCYITFIRPGEILRRVIQVCGK